MKEINLDRISQYFEAPKGKVTLGIDGFVDEVWQVISVRTSPTEYVLYEKMQDFAKSVYDVGAGGYGNEVIRKRRSHGGFTAHTGEAVDNLGIDLTLVGMFGKDSIDPVYQIFSDTCNVFSVGNTGVCPIFEFADGKLLLPYSEEIANLTWTQLTGALSPDELRAAFQGADIVGFGYWSLLDHFDDMVAKLCESVLTPGTRMFFDFADIRKRDKQALLDTLQLLAGLNSKFPMTLSLNEHEAGILFSYMGREFDWKNPEAADQDIEYVRQQTGLDALIVHTPYFAVAASASEGTAVVLQRHCKNPVLTTGAGDNFNGGYVAASAQQGALTLAERLLVANATSGHYLRNGYSPDPAELRHEMEQFSL
ncbi:MAG: carbohydrate kinase family protein [Oscillospiraceae bacterium]|nr:carbohydrate kinase family protein [Oscillospiraceae bacterium]